MRSGAHLAFLAVGAAAQFSVAHAEAPDRVAANRTLVLDFAREVNEAQDAEAARRFLSSDYIQHNPNVPGGLEGFIAFSKRIWPNGPRPVEPILRNPPVAIMADGDLVLLVARRPLPDPVDPSKTYDSFGFNLYRVRDGRIVEHWDAATKASPAPVGASVR